MDKATATDRWRLFNAVDAVYETTGFEHAILAADTLIKRWDGPDMAMLGMLARRLAVGTEPPASNVDLITLPLTRRSSRFLTRGFRARLTEIPKISRGIIRLNTTASVVDQ